MPIAAALPGLIGAGLDIYGMFRQQHQQEWENGLRMEEFNRRNAANERGVESWNASADPARDTALQLRDLFTNYLLGENGSQEQVRQLLSTYPGLIDQLFGESSNPWDRGLSPEQRAVMQQNLDARGGFMGGFDTAMGGFQNPNQPGREDAMARFMDMLNGQGGEMASLADVGTGLLGQRGETDFTRNTTDRAMDMFNRGGMTDPLQRAWAGAGSIADAQGATGTTNALQGRGLDLLGREALLPMDQAYQIAREDAARNAEGAFKRAQRQALARRGEAASVVAAGGSEGDAMSEWADAAARGVSDAGRNALVSQQGLNLQQMGQGTQMANLGQSMETQRLLEALGMMPTVANSAANNVSTYGGAALGAGNLANSRMNTGTGLLDLYNRTRLGAGNLMNSGLQDMGQYQLGMGGLANNFGNSYQNAGNNYFDQLLRGGTFGQERNTQQFNANQNYYQNTVGFNRDNMTGIGTSLDNLYRLASLGADYARAGLTGQNYGMTPAQNMANPWAAIGSGIANTDWGGLFGGGNSGSFNSGGFMDGTAAGQGLQNSWNSMISTKP